VPIDGEMRATDVRLLFSWDEIEVAADEPACRVKVNGDVLLAWKQIVRRSL
jgi:hypothetical protein